MHVMLNYLRFHNNSYLCAFFTLKGSQPNKMDETTSVDGYINPIYDPDLIY